MNILIMNTRQYNKEVIGEPLNNKIEKKQKLRTSDKIAENIFLTKPRNSINKEFLTT